MLLIYCNEVPFYMCSTEAESWKNINIEDWIPIQNNLYSTDLFHYLRFKFYIACLKDTKSNFSKLDKSKTKQKT